MKYKTIIDFVLISKTTAQHQQDGNDDDDDDDEDCNEETMMRIVLAANSLPRQKAGRHTTPGQDDHFEYCHHTEL